MRRCECKDDRELSGIGQTVDRFGTRTAYHGLSEGYLKTTDIAKSNTP